MLITVASEYEQYSLAAEPNINTPRYKTANVMNDYIIARPEETMDILQSEHILMSAILHLPHELTPSSPTDLYTVYIYTHTVLLCNGRQFTIALRCVL